MNIFTISSYLVFLSSTLIAILLFLKGRESRVGNILAFFCLSVSIYGLGGSKLSSTNSKGSALFWWQIAYIGIIFTPILYSHFIFIILKINEKYLIKIAYLLGFIFLFFNWYDNSNLFIGELRFVFNEFYCIDWFLKKNLIYLSFYICLFWGLLAYAFILLLRAYIHSKNAVRNRLKYFILGSCIGWFGAQFQLLLYFGIHIYPYANFLIAIYPALFAYAIIKHQLLDIEVLITRATVFALVYGVTFGLPFIIFAFWREQIHSLFHNFPWAIPTCIMGYAGLATITPFIYIRLERKAYYAIFGNFSSQLQILTRTSRDIIDKGFESALELAQTIPAHIISFYEETMRQKLKHAFYLLREEGYFIIHHGNIKCDRHKEGEKISQDDPLIKWFTYTREQLVQEKLIKRKNNNILDKQEVKAMIDDLSKREKYADLQKELIALNQAMEDIDIVLLLPSYYKDELMGILALGEKRGGYYRTEELEALQRLAENAAMVFKGSQLTASVIEAENIKKLEKVKSEFFANVSHELRTPLTNIILPIQNVLERMGHKITPENREEKEAILRNAHKLLKRINEILDIAKLESGKMQIKVRLRDVNSILEDIMAVSSIGAKGMQIDLTFKPDGNISGVYVDTEKIEKVFSNLVSNALKFTNPKGKVEIRTKDAGDHIEIIISDTGIGIVRKDLPYIFERFRQLDGSSSRKYEGTGIGLSLARELVELHHGSIEVTSELGKGTIFTVRLLKGNGHFKKEEIIEKPEIQTSDGFVERGMGERRKADRRETDRRKMCPADRVSIDLLQLQFSDLSQGRAYSQSAPGKSEKGGEKKTILVADDNRDLAGNIACCFTREYKILLAYNGKQALDLISKDMPDLVISDVMMPEMDGYQLCAEIKSHEQTQHVPVILLTAKAAVEDKIAGLQYGADEYLAKPFNAKELIAVVDSLLSKRELQAQLQKANQELKKALQELKETESELVHAARLASVGQLAAGVAHEIHNPASAIDNCFQIITKRIERIKGGVTTFDKIYPELIKFLTLGETSLKRIQDIVDSLLGFSRKNKEGFNLVDIHEGINNTLILLEHECREGIQIHKEYGKFEKIEADLQQINQVFMNLFTNALYAIRAKKEKGCDCGHIRIKTMGYLENVDIVVQDDGIGIPEDIQDKIFDPFFTTKEVGKGTGLGLNISYKIIKSHQGSIKVESRENEGTTFTMRLPKRLNPQNR